MITKAVIFLGIFSFSTYAASASYTGKIEKLNLHGNNWGTYNPNDLGVLNITMKGMPISCGQEDGYNRVVITSDHVLFTSVLSIVMAAKLADRDITIHYLNSCNVRSGSWDFGFVELGD